MTKFVLIALWWIANGVTPTVTQTDFPDSASCTAAQTAVHTVPTTARVFAVCVQSQTGLQ